MTEQFCLSRPKRGCWRVCRAGYWTSDSEVRLGHWMQRIPSVLKFANASIDASQGLGDDVRRRLFAMLATDLRTRPGRCL